MDISVPISIIYRGYLLEHCSSVYVGMFTQILQVVVLKIPYGNVQIAANSEPFSRRSRISTELSQFRSVALNFPLIARLITFTIDKV
jgi:Flp pilus assembly protein protease CpaA